MHFFILGHIYIEARRAVNAIVHMDQAYEVYKSWSTPRKYKPQEPVLKMRQFLFLMKVTDFATSGICFKFKLISCRFRIDSTYVHSPWFIFRTLSWLILT